MSAIAYRLMQGDASAQLRRLPDGIARTCVTSPPYWGLRDYGVAGQIGLEDSLDEYVKKLVGVFREVRRVLSDDGTLWLNLGDSYAGGWGGARDLTESPKQARNNHMPVNAKAGDKLRAAALKRKDLVGIPWRVAFALHADGWWLRSDIIWHKPNPMPESVTDRPTKAHEYVFLLAKSEQYFYDAVAIAEPAVGDHPRNVDSLWQAPGRSLHNGLLKDGLGRKQDGHGRRHAGFNERWFGGGDEPRSDRVTRNKRSVWTIATTSFSGEHFATFPEKLALPCILAGSESGDFVLDPFCGAGTTGLVALKQGRSFIGVELNPEYLAMSRTRLATAAPLFACEETA